MPKITGVSLFEVRLPLRHEFETSSHRKTSLTHILVALQDGAGNTGWGEIASPADPFFCAETNDTAWLIAEKYFAKQLVGVEFETPYEFEKNWAKIRGNEFVKSGFSIAGWDLFAKAAGVSLAAALGGERERVQAGVSLGIETSIDALLTEVEKHVAAGYERVKLKIAPGWDLEPTRAVRGAFPAVDVHVDANAVYEPGEAAFALFKQLDKLELTMFEQPFAQRDFLSHAELQKRVATPVCLDESVVSLDDLRLAHALNAIGVLNIKVSRMGGLTVARAAHDFAVEVGIPVWCGGMHEFGIGRAANVALSALPGFTLPSDVSASEKYYREDIIDPVVTANGGMVTVPSGAGIGHAVREQMVRDLALRVLEV
ncbi:o-succinylbenzoate synthase [Canibacter zhoujuaniae]|uniref:o-succinylbenzoate synthase n=1 Tax=Canibacter zhoujuaniae TaxID=2708343 RepID=UPI001423CFA1|nr:o-succinylbenzoate synthase [Canibacter zhoujuaniae]